jgi:3-hydroxyisobutyrate dehydrogenase-like beta-hydroxyacid dehydrogenase
MVGGDQGIFDEVVGILDAVAVSVVHVGPIGTANTAKLADQVVVALNIAAAVLEMFTALKADGHEGDDHGRFVQFYESVAGTTLDPTTPTT